MATLEREIQEQIAALAPAQQRQVLEYARALGREVRGVPGKALLQFAGTIAPDDLREIIAAVEDGCERVDPHGW